MIELGFISAVEVRSEIPWCLLDFKGACSVLSMPRKPARRGKRLTGNALITLIKGFLAEQVALRGILTGAQFYP